MNNFLQGGKYYQENYICLIWLQGDEFQTKLNQLLEMFPDSCNLEISHCLNLMAGDIEEAAQLIIQRQESGQSLQQKRVRD